ncbi:Prophage pi2 protein 32 [Hypericibacter terrae]|uniref:Prophage pi2 protein 32 n=1 Tax=Hypericibacter terrae TaxID=2602015 RepID=A0A5J6MUJ4_9PROT|nr:HK97 family phage prohead protease [Hypericibacter terrae]QEX18506.1 Prophage pi2 protein 32 [Hypericibacter terrae]
MSIEEIERRFFVAEELEVEKRADGKPVLRGHAAVFNKLSENLGGFREQVAPGAFLETIQKDDIRALFNHDPNFVLGRNRSKTLTLSEDARGLAIEIEMPDTQTIRDLVVAPIQRRDVSQMSFGFAVRAGGQDWGDDGKGNMIRTLKQVRLFDVSPVTFPAYPQTDIAVRSLTEWKAELQRQAAAATMPNLRAMRQRHAEI